ncbi:N-formylglutamate amidohydrolase [Sphingosinicella humi]|uniref:N-formylglutamate amidohydrolase n=1 Tax=Allosphingosinicella humi TaxID=2068657 RepID=A0A2U2J093_9SPHN|nr:N-formylglutamate amidohydrolase [Sphingosinicella humi]PWG01756.1 N-formylglutamate amidohydrolase [Sphingosinicella humi]
MAESPNEPPFLRVGPGILASPVVLSVPHAGRAYSPDLIRASRLPVDRLETLEDRLVDRLIWRAVAEGSTALVAQVPRAEIDLNRDEREVDAAMVSPPPRALLATARTRGGLGLVPSRISGAGAIWLGRMTGAELTRRIDTVHRPYHEALAQLLEDARDRFGVAILLDCHSMPPRDRTRGSAELVFGDRHGASIALDLLEAAIAAAEAEGFSAVRNAPYAGGYITARHGRPDRGIHALQLEIDRSTYLGADLRSPGPGFERTARMIAAVAAALSARAQEAPQSIAAE